MLLILYKLNIWFHVCKIFLQGANAKVICKQFVIIVMFINEHFLTEINGVVSFMKISYYNMQSPNASASGKQPRHISITL